MSRRLPPRPLHLRSLLRAATLAVGLAVLAACETSGGARAGTPGRLLTPLDYLAVGVDGLRRYVADASGEDRARIQNALEAGRAAVVRVEVRSPERGGEASVRGATGVALAGGRGILTAGHVLTERDGEATIRVAFRGGAGFEARVAGVEFERFRRDAVDLGRLVVEGDDGTGARVAAPAVGQLVIGLGFPDGFGLSDGDVLMDAGLDDGPLEPIPVLARVESARPLSLTLVAGSMPIEGMSGSPFFDLDGNCVGVLSRVEASETTSSASRWRILASPLDEFQDGGPDSPALPRARGVGQANACTPCSPRDCRSGKSRADIARRVRRRRRAARPSHGQRLLAG